MFDCRYGKVTNLRHDGIAQKILQRFAMALDIAKMHVRLFLLMNF
jgi:hypothetical protein